MTVTRARPSSLSRRQALLTSGVGLGGLGSLAFAGLVNRAHAASADPRSALVHKPRAKRVIFLFMHGGPSQVDTFDWKPRLHADDGKPLPFAQPRVTFSKTGNLLRSPWKFKQHGQSGAWVSELFPEVARVSDDLCFIKSLHGTNPAHGGALLSLHTGSDTFVRPSMGSWILYGLGNENPNLPGFITICPSLGHGGVQNWSSAFLPAVYQGMPIGNAGIPSEKARIEHLTNPYWDGDLQRAQLDLLQQENVAHREARGANDSLDARTASYEMAFRMQMTAPERMDLSSESKATMDLYGIGEKATENFGRQCLMARRFAESGVRFIQCSHSYKWDQHENLRADHTRNAREVDRPIAGLIKDLKSRGLLDDTLVLWAGEFGRTPTAQGGNDGRDHNPHGFTIWMAGAGIKAGTSYGATDDYGYYAVENKVHIHDLHATILYMLGLDHERLTYRHAGRDFRLTDVAGHVVKDVLA